MSAADVAGARRGFTRLFDGIACRDPDGDTSEKCGFGIYSITVMGYKESEES